MLITALQFRDELEALKKGMHQNPETLTARTSNLHWSDGAPNELKEVAAQVLDLLSQGAKTMAHLYRQCSVCELKLYQVVTELIYSDQVCFTAKADGASSQVSAATKMDVEPRHPQGRLIPIIGG